MFTPRSRLVPTSVASSASHPYKGFDASSGSNPAVYIQIGSHNSKVPTISGVALSVALTANLLNLGSTDKIVYVELDVTSGSISAAIVHHSASTGPPSDSVSGGTGAAYQTLFFTDVAITGGIASVGVSDNVSGAQAYQNCSSTNQALYGLV
jgi:hypothetical protein